MDELTVILPNRLEIKGTEPVVIIGPNGSGKTTFANSLSKTNNAEWIGATRNLQFSDSIQMQTPEVASTNLTNHKNNQKNSPWILANELDQLLAKLKAEDADSAVKFRNNSIQTNGLKPETTKILQLTNIWNSIFPQREMNFSSYSPYVKANHRGGDKVGISRMSGGERVALYLLARVLDAPQNTIIFIDEPEIHFHKVLAKKFWNELEILRADCRFVYITHDLSFAISRKNCQIIILKSEQNYEVLTETEEIPDDIIESILGAATLSISAKRVIFCEGSRNNKMDDEIYSLWYGSDDTEVIPVGSCNEVIKCVEVFNNNSAIKGTKAFGIIDRDFHPDEYFEQLPETVYVLPLHEIESLFCSKEIYYIVGKELGKKEDELNTEYFEILENVINHFNNNLEKNKIILERAKQKTEGQSRNLLNSINDPSKDIDIIKKDYLDALEPKNWSFSPENIFEEEKEKVNNTIKNKNSEEIMVLFPGKVFWGRIVTKLGMSQTSFLGLIIKHLNDPKSVLRSELYSVLEHYLPKIPK